MITEHYPETTIADYNFGAGNQPFALSGIITQSGNTYCANCAGHVSIFGMDVRIGVIFKDDSFCGVCHGCYVSICNCKIEG